MICYSNILTGLHQKAVCVASELTSPALVSKFYDPEYEATHDNPDKDPYMAFEKDFMRFMLSDGAGAVLVQDHPEGICPLKIEWVDMISYANELPTCMFMASELQKTDDSKVGRSSLLMRLRSVPYLLANRTFGS